MMTPELFAKTIASIEQNYGLRLDARSVWLRMDDWKRLGRDQMGQKCGRGWQGLRGACKRVPKGGDKDAAIKASKVALADKIRKNKGLRDRNAPKVEGKGKPQEKGQTALNLARGDYGKEGHLTTEVKPGLTSGYLARLSPSQDKSHGRSFVSASDKRTTREGNGENHYKLNALDDGLYEAETVFRSAQKKRHYLKVQNGTITSQFNDLNEAEDHEYPGLKKDRQNIQTVKKQEASVHYGDLTGSEKQVSWASGLRDKGSKEVLKELSSFPDSPEKTKAIDIVNDFVKSKSSSRDWIDNRSQLGSWIKKGASEKAARSN